MMEFTGSVSKILEVIGLIEADLLRKEAAGQTVLSDEEIEQYNRMINE